MRQFKRILSTPHEMLHVLALMLIGRRAVKVADDHIVIPDDLTMREYVFVAGLPALVLFGILAVAAVALINAQTPNQAGIATAVIIVSVIGAAGTIGDLQLILWRLNGRAE